MRTGSYGRSLAGSSGGALSVVLRQGPGCATLVRAWTRTSPVPASHVQSSTHARYAQRSSYGAQSTASIFPAVVRDEPRSNASGVQESCARNTFSHIPHTPLLRKKVCTVCGLEVWTSLC